MNDDAIYGVTDSINNAFNRSQWQLLFGNENPKISIYLNDFHENFLSAFVLIISTSVKTESYPRRIEHEVLIFKDRNEAVLKAAEIYSNFISREISNVGTV